MTTPHRTLQMALDALYSGESPPNARQQAAADALREALAAPEPEPVGTVYTMEALVPGGDVRCHVDLHKALPAGTKLYAAPPAAPVVPVSWDRLRVLMDSIPTREEFIGGQRQKYVAKEEVMGWLYESQLRAEREAPPAAPAPADIEELRHVANEWSDMATSMVVWLRNIADGTSTPEAALENAEKCLAHCRKVNDTSQALSKAIAAAPAPAAPVVPADCCRNELLTALHTLASNYENALGMFGQDGEGRRKAEGDLAHAMQVAAKHNRNGPGCAAPVVREPRHVRKVGGSFEHKGTVVAEFKTTAGEPRIVLEFDAPVAGMLHVYRPDQVEPCEPVAPAAPPAAPAPAAPVVPPGMALVSIDELSRLRKHANFNVVELAYEQRESPGPFVGLAGTTNVMFANDADGGITGGGK